MPLTRRQLLIGGAAASVAGFYGCGRFRAGAVGGPYDVVIVGSGFAGTHIALETAAAGLETALVEAAPEAGIDFISRGEGSPFESNSTGEIDYDYNKSRVIGIGGTSRHWTGRVNRLRPSDFRLASEFGLDVDWPISYAQLEPYYCEAERLLSAIGGEPVPGAEPRRECDYPRVREQEYRAPEVSYGGEPLPFFGVARSAHPETNRPVRLAEEEIPRFVEMSTASLVAGFQAVDAVTTDGKSIDHLVVRSVEGHERRLRARCYVLAAGVIETPRILLQSRSSWYPNGLGNSHGHLGRYFVEHPTLMVRFEPRESEGLYVGSHRTYFFNDRFRAEGLNACHYQLQFKKDGRVDWKMQPEMEPREENRLALSAATDRYGAPLTELTFGYSERDRRTIERGLEFLLDETRRLGGDPAELELIRKFRDHPAGTCRMGFEPSDGVVDRRHRVFGMDNLYVSGATTFPTSGTANPTTTVVAMTLRLAEILVQEYS